MKPKLLDLFCGQIDAHNGSCYNKVCIKSNVSIAGKKSMPSVQVGRSFAVYVATFGMSTIYLVNGNVSNVASHSPLSMPLTTTVATVLNLVQRRLSPKKLRRGGSLIPKLMRFINERIWRRILDCIAIRPDEIGLKPSAYWGANV